MNADPKVLVFDIETSDLAADIGHIISIGWMWLGEKAPTCIDISMFPGKTIVDDSELLKKFTAVYNEADLTVAHFGEYFDLAFLQTRLAVHGLPPLDRIKMVDTWRIAKKRLKFGSNRLERIMEVMKCPYAKTPVKMAVWSLARCGDKKAIKYVVDHNIKDVLALEWVYRKLRPFWDQHPALYNVNSDRQCRACGSSSVKSKGRMHLTNKNVFQRLRCEKCGRTWVGKRIFPED